MLVPAASRKDEIVQKSQELYYTMDYFYYIGDLDCRPIEVVDSPERGFYQFASVDADNNVIGYIGYWVDFYNETAYNFGLLSFDKGNLTLAKDLNEVLNSILENPIIHRIEFRMVGANPIEHSYDRFCKLHNGEKHVLHRVVKDMYGEFHDMCLYEILC